MITPEDVFQNWERRQVLVHAVQPSDALVEVIHVCQQLRASLRPHGELLGAAYGLVSSVQFHLLRTILPFDCGTMTEMRGRLRDVVLLAYPNEARLRDRLIEVLDQLIDNPANPKEGWFANPPHEHADGPVGVVTEEDLGPVIPPCLQTGDIQRIPVIHIRNVTMLKSQSWRRVILTTGAWRRDCPLLQALFLGGYCSQIDILRYHGLAADRDVSREYQSREFGMVAEVAAPAAPDDLLMPPHPLGREASTYWSGGDHEGTNLDQGLIVHMDGAEGVNHPQVALKAKAPCPVLNNHGTIEYLLPKDLEPCMQLILPGNDYTTYRNLRTNELLQEQRHRDIVDAVAQWKELLSQGLQRRGEGHFYRRLLAAEPRFGYSDRYLWNWTGDEVLLPRNRLVFRLVISTAHAILDLPLLDEQADQWFQQTILLRGARLRVRDQLDARLLEELQHVTPPLNSPHHFKWDGYTTFTVWSVVEVGRETLMVPYHKLNKVVYDE